MKNLLLFLQKNHRQVYILFVFAVTTIAVLYVYPGKVQFKYDFQKGKPWQHEDLKAPFSFTKQKSPKEIEAEKKLLEENKDLFFQKSNDIAAKQFEALANDWYSLNVSDSIKKSDSLTVWKVFSFVYKRGVLERTLELDAGNRRNLYLITDNKVEQFQQDDYFSASSAQNLLEESLHSAKLRVALAPYFVPNILFDNTRTQDIFEEKIGKIITNSGFVKQGDLIILRGGTVDEEKYLVLTSLKSAYEGGLAEESSSYLLTAGQLIYILLLLGVLYFFIYFFRRTLLNYIANINLILFTILWMVILSILVIRLNAPWLYIVPFPIVPIIMRAFYDTRIALFVHIITILLVGYYAPNGFEFMMIEFIAGMSAIINVSGLYKRSQLFVAALKIVGIYLLGYMAFVLLQESIPGREEWISMGYLVASGFFSLLAFPLIYLYEKLFGQVSDLTLLELADTNSPLLRELAQKAPGTFHHSIQVANLSERAALTIEANTLLVRTGALYHDIGKMQKPLYFVENQATGVNPHDDLSFKESAKIIVNHVLDGVKLAKKNRLPDLIIDFIRTHHGTTKVEYFYRQYLKSFPEEEQTVDSFSYPGPKPFSKETAILMMADSVEAASRSLKEKTTETINALIDKIIEHQLTTGQFNNSNITLKEIEEIKGVFKQQLANIYHARIEYPEKIK